MDFREKLSEHLRKTLKEEIKLEVPPDPSLGDAALPCFAFAKTQKKPPALIAQELAKNLSKPDFVERITAHGPYVNFFFKKADVAEKILLDISYQKEKYGSSDEGKGKTVIVEFSSPNIAKPLHFGHLRGTVLGNCISLLHEFNGYKVIRWNYLGDWGTPFGNLISAYLQWGDRKKLEQNPIKHLFELYVKFTEEAKKNPALENEGRAWFKKLEENSTEAVKHYTKFKHLSIHAYNKVYDLLNVHFDDYNGEAFFKDKTEDAIDLCEEKKLAKKDKGALVIPLNGFDIPFMLRKSDDTTTYASRDIAALLHRTDTYRPAKLVYVVGHEQCLHFRQLFAVAELLGYPKDKFEHVDFGLYLGPEGQKMATRKGKVVFLEDALAETIALAKKTIQQKNPKLKDKDRAARAVAVGAVIFGDVMNDRNRAIVFDKEKFLDFEGDTGPYLQYTYARASSIIRKAKAAKLPVSAKVTYALLSKDVEKRLVAHLGEFRNAVVQALRNYKPHIIAQYLLQLGRTFNEFYHACPIIQEENKDIAKARLLLVDCSRTVLRNGLRLLGIEALEEM